MIHRRQRSTDIFHRIITRRGAKNSYMIDLNQLSETKKKRISINIQDQFKHPSTSRFRCTVRFSRVSRLISRFPGRHRFSQGTDASSTALTRRSARSLRWYSGARTRADRDAFGPFSRVTVSATFTLFPAAVGAPNIRLFRAFLDDLDVTCSPLTSSWSSSSSSSSLSLKVFRCRRGWNARVNRASNVRT